MLNIEALTAFVAIVDEGSFSAAAERLGQTPSGIGAVPCHDWKVSWV